MRFTIEHNIHSQDGENALSSTSEEGRVRVDHPTLGEVATVWWDEDTVEVLVHKDAAIKPVEKTDTPIDGYTRAVLTFDGPRYRNRWHGYEFIGRFGKYDGWYQLAPPMTRSDEHFIVLRWGDHTEYAYICGETLEKLRKEAETAERDTFYDAINELVERGTIDDPSKPSYDHQAASSWLYIYGRTVEKLKESAGFLEEGAIPLGLAAVEAAIEQGLIDNGVNARHPKPSSTLIDQDKLTFLTRVDDFDVWVQPLQTGKGHSIWVTDGKAARFMKYTSATSPTQLAKNVNDEQRAVAYSVAIGMLSAQKEAA